jgi:hypothetical protein
MRVQGERAPTLRQGHRALVGLYGTARLARCPNNGCVGNATVQRLGTLPVLHDGDPSPYIGMQPSPVPSKVRIWKVLMGRKRAIHLGMSALWIRRRCVAQGRLEVLAEL